MIAGDPRLISMVSMGERIQADDLRIQMLARDLLRVWPH